MRIAGITIPDKRLEIALTSVYGIGRPLAKKILAETNIEFGRKTSSLTSLEESTLGAAISKCRIEGDLRRDVSRNVKRLKDIKAYRGVRHMKRLPVRGQGTKTNSRTVRGNVRKTMLSGKRKTEKT